MRYYYLVDTDKDFAVCFNSKKSMVDYAMQNCFVWYYVVNKKQIPDRIKKIVGNGICKDYKVREKNFVMKNSLKDKKKED